jgi:hypothetical protein
MRLSGREMLHQVQRPGSRTRNRLPERAAAGLPAVVGHSLPEEPQAVLAPPIVPGPAGEPTRQRTQTVMHQTVTADVPRSSMARPVEVALSAGPEGANLLLRRPELGAA